MKYLLYALLFTVMTGLSCGVETVLIILPLLSANWCDAAQNCHVYEFRPGQEASDTQERGTLGGIEYWIRNGVAQPSVRSLQYAIYEVATGQRESAQGLLEPGQEAVENPRRPRPSE